MKEILVSGDSFSAYHDRVWNAQYYEKYGIPFSDVGIPLPKYVSWPELLSEKLNKKLISLSIGGVGNFSICKKAQDYIVNNHQKIDLCIIALSGWNRIENTVFKRKSSFFYSKDVQRWDKVKDFEMLVENDLSQKDSYIINNNLRSIYELQEICKKFNVNYVMFQMLKPLDVSLSTKKHLEGILENPYFNMIDDSKIIGWPFFEFLGGYNFYDRYLNGKKEYAIGDMIRVTIDENSKKPKLEPFFDTHPNQQGHNKLLEVIEKII